MFIMVITLFVSGRLGFLGIELSFKGVLPYVGHGARHSRVLPPCACSPVTIIDLMSRYCAMAATDPDAEEAYNNHSEELEATELRVYEHGSHPRTTSPSATSVGANINGGAVDSLPSQPRSRGSPIKLFWKRHVVATVSHDACRDHFGKCFILIVVGIYVDAVMVYSFLIFCCGPLYCLNILASSYVAHDMYLKAIRTTSRSPDLLLRPSRIHIFRRILKSFNVELT